jgi:hypothetical protein
LFEHNDSLYRPAQDCSRAYGEAIALNRIRVSSPNTLAEENVNVLDGQPDGRSCKSLASAVKQLVQGRFRHGSAQAR